MLLFLPAIIFESAFNCDWHVFKKQFGKILILAGPLICMGTVGCAYFMYYTLGYGDRMDFVQCCLFGSIISATDPIAVVALLKEIGAS